MKCYFGEKCNSFYVKTFREAMEAIEDGAADFAVLPIENSTAGAVDEMYDLLVEFENYIVGETVIPIRHTLSGLPGASLEEVKTVYSKGVALMQAACTRERFTAFRCLQTILMITNIILHVLL